MMLVRRLDKTFGIAPPIHFSQAQIERVEGFADEAGWKGPVLWYIPENITLDDLVDLQLLDPRWWTSEPNFPRSIPTVSPYDDSGYWVLGVPIPHPITRNCSLQEQVRLLPRIAHALGFRKADIVLGDATDLAFMMALGLYLNGLQPREPFALRSETCLHLSARNRSSFEHLDALNVSLVVSSMTIQLGDYPNKTRAPFLGIAPLLY